MKMLPYGILIFGAWLVMDAVHSQQSGVARTLVPGSRYGTMETAKRANDPKAFQNLMRYQWFEAGGILFMGFVVLMKVRREESLDPFSESFAGAAQIDELERTINEKAEERNARKTG